MTAFPYTLNEKTIRFGDTYTRDQDKAPLVSDLASISWPPSVEMLLVEFFTTLKNYIIARSVRGGAKLFEDAAKNLAFRIKRFVDIQLRPLIVHVKNYVNSGHADKALRHIQMVERSVHVDSDAAYLTVAQSGSTFENAVKKMDKSTLLKVDDLHTTLRRYVNLHDRTLEFAHYTEQMNDEERTIEAARLLQSARDTSSALQKQLNGDIGNIVSDVENLVARSEYKTALKRIRKDAKMVEEEYKQNN